jgi:hypothetical protein
LLLLTARRGSGIQAHEYDAGFLGFELRGRDGRGVAQGVQVGVPVCGFEGGVVEEEGGVVDF